MRLLYWKIKLNKWIIALMTARSQMLIQQKFYVLYTKPNKFVLIINMW